MFNALKKNIVIMYKQMRNLNKEMEAIKKMSQMEIIEQTSKITIININLTGLIVY